jgi:flagellar hook-length control protein FliK
VAISTDQKQLVNTRILPNLAAKQISVNTNSSIETSNANSNFQTQSVVTKDNAPLKNAKEKTIGEMKTGELKTGELKTGELKSADVKIGQVKLERIAPANLNQVIINALSPTGKFSPISANVIMPGQISNQLQKTLTIQLHPENLGVVEVKISVKNGNLSISVETNTLVAEKILKAEISVVTEKLAILGILHEEMTVRNNPGLDIVKDSNNHERNGGMNSNHAGDGQNATDGENDFGRQLDESKVSEGKIGETDQIFAASEEAGNKRDGIYL